jgi:hypothetical protein
MEKMLKYKVRKVAKEERYRVLVGSNKLGQVTCDGIEARRDGFFAVKKANVAQVSTYEKAERL